MYYFLVIKYLTLSKIYPKLTDRYNVVTPANWKDGDEVIISPELIDEGELNKQFPRGYRIIKRYMFYTDQPSKSK